MVLVALIAVACITTPASASSIRECGNYGFTADGDGPLWTYQVVNGATPAYNLTTRRVSCRRARRFALRYRGTDTYFPRWNCREVNKYEWSDIRCTATHGRVIHWQAGA